MVNSCIVLGIPSAAIQTLHTSTSSDLFYIYLLLWIDLTDSVEFIPSEHSLLDLNGTSCSDGH